MGEAALIENGTDQFEWPMDPFTWGRAPIYKLTAKTNGHISAVKVLRVGIGPTEITPKDIEYELRNARKIKAWKHVNIVEILSVASDIIWRDGYLASFIQMEKCQSDLHQMIFDIKRTNEQISLREYYGIISDVLSGLAFLHENKLIHRDIKARNSIQTDCNPILIEVLRKTNGTWALCDFGISVERLSGRLRPSSRGRMSIETCAPEMMTPARLHDERLDIWAIGCVAYYLATGQQLFPAINNFCQLAGLFGQLRQDQVPSILPDAKLLVKLESAYPVTPDDVFAPILKSSLQLEFKRRASARQLRALTGSLLLPVQFGATWPRKLPADSNFKGRQNIMESICNGFNQHLNILLHGLPGVGKTALAAEYILRFRDRYRRVVYFQLPFEDSLESLFGILIREGPPSIEHWLRFYYRGLIVIDLENTRNPSKLIIKFLSELLDRGKNHGIHVLIVSRNFHEPFFTQNVLKLKVHDLTIPEAKSLARSIVGCHWDCPRNFAETADCGYRRPVLLKHILTSRFDISDAIKRTQRLRQQAALCQTIRIPFLDSTLGHQAFNTAISNVNGLGPGGGDKIILLAYLSPGHIDAKLATMIYAQWYRKRLPYVIRSGNGSSQITISLLTSADLESWANASIIEWNTASKKAFFLDPYIQTAIFYKFCRSDLNLGRMLWENTRTVLEKYAKLCESELLHFYVGPHLNRLLDARPSLADGRMNFVTEYDFPGLWSVFKESHRYQLPEREGGARGRQKTR